MYKKPKQAKKATELHPKAHLCLALNLARYRFVEALQHATNDRSIEESNWKKKSPFENIFNLDTAGEKETAHWDKIKEHLPFVKSEHETTDACLEKLRTLLNAGTYLSKLRNYYSHTKHAPINIDIDKNKSGKIIIREICRLYAEAYERLLNRGYKKEDLEHLKLKDERCDGYFKDVKFCIAKSEPEEHEYALFYKNKNVYEFTKRGAAFIACLFLDVKEANELLSSTAGFRKTEEKKNKATRDLFTYYSGKVIFDKENTESKQVSLFFNMVSYLSKKPEYIAEITGETGKKIMNTEKETGDEEQTGEVRRKDLFSHYALRYLFMCNENDDFFKKDPVKIYQYKKIPEKSLRKTIETAGGEKIPVYDFEYKEYSDDLIKRVAYTGNNIYFRWGEANGIMGFKALSHLVFAILIRNEDTYNNILLTVKNEVNSYIESYRKIMAKIKNGAIGNVKDLEAALQNKPVKIGEIPEAIINGFGLEGVESDEDFLNRITAKLNEKIKDCNERLKETETIKINHLVTFILQDYTNFIPHGKKPGKELYKELHRLLTFYGRYKPDLVEKLRNKDWDYENHFLSKALVKDDLREVYKTYVEELKLWCENTIKDIQKETDAGAKLQKTNEAALKTGTNRKHFSPQEGESRFYTSNPKDIADMILNKPVPLPDNFIGSIILREIQIEKDGKTINRAATLIDIYVRGVGLDPQLSDNEKNKIFEDYYIDIENKYKPKEQKKVRLFRTQDKLLWLIVNEYADGFIKGRVAFDLNKNKPVSELYKSNAELDFFGRKIKFLFSEYNKIKRLLYDKRIENITKYHIDPAIVEIVFNNNPKEFIISKELSEFRKSQKDLVSAALKFEDRYFNNFGLQGRLKDVYEKNGYIEHPVILEEAIKDKSLNDFRKKTFHNSVPEEKNYFADAIKKYENYKF